MAEGESEWRDDVPIGPPADVSRERTVGLVVFGLGLLMWSFLPALYTVSDAIEANLGWIEVGGLFTLFAPIPITWGLLAFWTGQYRPLTAVRSLPIPAIGVATFTVLDQLNPNAGLTDTVGSGTVRDPTIVESVGHVFATDGVLVGALACVLVGVVLARRGVVLAVASLVLPLSLAFFGPPIDPQTSEATLVGVGLLLFGAGPFAFGYLVATGSDGVTNWRTRVFPRT